MAPGVSMLIGQGGNIGVSTGADGVLLIDDQYAPLHPKIAAALEALHSGPVRYVLNTHWHGDHTGGNEPFARGGALPVPTFGSDLTLHWNGEELYASHVERAHTAAAS